MFNDAVAEISDPKIAQILKTVSGTDPQRIEDKFKKPTTDFIKAFLILTTNNPVTLENCSDFAALFRRFIILDMKKTIKQTAQKLSFDKELLETGEAEELILYFILNRKFIDKTTDYLKNINFQNEIVANQDTSSFNIVDPLLAFSIDKLYQFEGAETSVYLIVLEYIQYYIDYFDPNLEILEYNNLLGAMDEVKKNPLCPQTFDTLVKVWDPIRNFWKEQKKSLEHLPMLSRSNCSDFIVSLKKR